MPGKEEIIMDLSGITFLPARKLAEIQKQRYEQDMLGGSLRLINVTPELAEELELVDIKAE